MTRTDVLAAGIILAIILAAAADVVALRARRYGARALLTAHSHSPRRRDPGDRRVADSGPPDGSPDRRRHRAPDDDRARRRDADQPRWHTVETPLSVGEALEVQRRFTREAITGSGDGPEHPQGLAADEPPVPLSDGRTVQPPEWWAARRAEQRADEPPTRDMRHVDPGERPT